MKKSPLRNFFHERFGTDHALEFFQNKIFPDHWSFYLGEFTLYAFVLLVGTGIWLTFVYDPSPQGAYPSVLVLTKPTSIGYLIRQIHHWSALVFLAAMVIHMSRIFFTAAFRKPREVNWIIGLVMLVLAVLTGFTGYSLPNDALSGVGVRIADAVTLSLPLIGGWAATVLNGGAYPGPLLLSHLYTIHVYYLPIAIAGLVGAHLFLVVYQKHTQFVRKPDRVVGRRLWPDYALRALAAFFLMFTVILMLAATIDLNPIERFGVYQDWTADNPAAPDWYAGFLDGALRIGPAREFVLFGHPIPAVFWPGVVMPTVVIGLLMAWPWIDAKIRGDQGAWHDVLVPATEAPWRFGVGVAFLTAGTVLTTAATDDQQSMALHVPVTTLVWVYRIALPLLTLLFGLCAAAIAKDVQRARAAKTRAIEHIVTIERTADGGFREKEIGH